MGITVRLLQRRSKNSLRLQAVWYTAEANYFLTTLFPADQLHILDYNRLVKDLNGFTEPEFLNRLGKDFLVGKVDKAFSPGTIHEFGMYLQPVEAGRNWFLKEGSYSE